MVCLGTQMSGEIRFGWVRNSPGCSWVSGGESGLAPARYGFLIEVVE